MIILHIDTSSNKETVVGLEISGKKDELRKVSDTWKSQAVLPMIHELLKKHKISFHDVTEITVHVGPGSFTGLRVGVAIANALGTFLRVPINGKKPGEIVEPIYQ